MVKLLIIVKGQQGLKRIMIRWDTLLLHWLAGDHPVKKLSPPVSIHRALTMARHAVSSVRTVEHRLLIRVRPTYGGPEANRHPIHPAPIARVASVTGIPTRA